MGTGCDSPTDRTSIQPPHEKIKEEFMKQPYSRATKVASVIKSAMLRNGITSQKELSEMSGINPTNLSKRFNGDVWWDLVELWRLNAVLNFTDEEWLKIRGCGRK